MNIFKINLEAIQKDHDVVKEILPKNIVSCKILRINGPYYYIPPGREGVYVYHLILDGTEYGIIETLHTKYVQKTGNEYVFDPSEKFTICKHDIGECKILQVVVNK